MGIFEEYLKFSENYYKNLMQNLLGDDSRENRVFSPLNIYLALGMLAELTAGNSRAQILELLDVQNGDSQACIETLRKQAEAIFETHQHDEEGCVSTLASSLWLRDHISFVQATMDRLADIYRASSHQGVMGSDTFNQELQIWLNEQTGGLLKEQASDVTLNASTILALATTVYFRAAWADAFLKENTAPGLFHTLGMEGDITCDYMHQSKAQNFYRGDHFSSVVRNMGNNYFMWFVLPDQDTTVQELVQDEQLTNFLLSNGRWDNQDYLTVNMTVPKFDVVSDLNLIENLQHLGITDVFNGGIADFSPMTTDVANLFLSQVQHAARVTIDEEGCEAAAYTVMGIRFAAMPPQETVDFVLDRPFLFAITGMDGLPLFTGVVHKP